MPFGLKNVTNMFSQTMVGIFVEWMQKFLKVFMDDLNIHNIKWEKHFQHIHMVLQCLREVNLKLNSNKYVFVAKSIKFLGHVVEKSKTRPDLEKVKAVLEFPIPRIVINVRAFLGLIGYYHNYVKDNAHIIMPLFELTKWDVIF